MGFEPDGDLDPRGLDSLGILDPGGLTPLGILNPWGLPPLGILDPGRLAPLAILNTGRLDSLGTLDPGELFPLGILDPGGLAPLGILRTGKLVPLALLNPGELMFSLFSFLQYATFLGFLKRLLSSLLFIWFSLKSTNRKSSCFANLLNVAFHTRQRIINNRIVLKSTNRNIFKRCCHVLLIS